MGPALDQPQSSQHERTPQPDPQGQVLVEEENRRDDPDDRDEEGERARRPRADALDTFIEEDEGEDRSEGRQVEQARPGDRRRGGQRSLSQPNPTRSIDQYS